MNQDNATDLSRDATSSRVRRWRAKDIAAHTGIPRGTLAHGVLAKLESDRVLNRIGRSWFGRAVDLDAWMLGRWKGQP